MSVLPIVLVAFACFNGLSAAPTGADGVARIETDPELTAGYFEGDIVLDTQTRNGRINETYRWPDNIVYYFISSNIGKIVIYMRQYSMINTLHNVFCRSGAS